MFYEDLKKGINLGVQHISLYGLSIEEIANEIGVPKRVLYSRKDYIKGKNIEISYRYNTEQFIISETDSNTITLKYQGRSSYSQILGLYFETSNQSITLTKGSETGNGNESDNDNGNASGNLGLVGKWRVSQQQNLIYNIIEFLEIMLII